MILHLGIILHLRFLSKGKHNLGVFGFKCTMRGFPGGAVVKNPPANAGDTGSSPGPGGSHMPWNS